MYELLYVVDIVDRFWEHLLHYDIIWYCCCDHCRCAFYGFCNIYIYIYIL